MFLINFSTAQFTYFTAAQLSIIRRKIHLELQPWIEASRCFSNYFQFMGPITIINASPILIVERLWAIIGHFRNNESRNNGVAQIAQQSRATTRRLMVATAAADVRSCGSDTRFGREDEWSVSPFVRGDHRATRCTRTRSTRIGS